MHTDPAAPAPAPTRTRRLAGLTAAGTVVGLAAALIGASAASAHVRVSSLDATQGGYSVVTFRAPTESDTASTTALTVTMPTDTPITYAATQPMPGWTSTVTTAKLAKPVQSDDGEIDTYVQKVTWKATGAGAAVPPGEFQQFDLSMGPFPNQERISFGALQTYSDGTEVDWNQTSTGGAEPEHPAPVLELAAAAGTAAESASPTGGPTEVAAAAPASSTAGLATGVVGIVLGAVAVVLALVALLRGRRRGTSGA
ncbi:YcnI family protein [Amnibacterium endophyticum]|uniref:YcnI family protein n=1 Tax=Amnibacterium endophyticum TaxID=2109337 RepID=A0ABW4LIX5_9MICO